MGWVASRRAPSAKSPSRRSLSQAGLAVFVLTVVASSVLTVGPAEAEKGIVYAIVDGEKLELRIAPPPDGRAKPAVVLVHGGGWRNGDASQLQLIADLVIEQGWVAVSPDYRLDQQPGYPAEPDDIALAVAFVRDHAAEYGVDPSRIALLGSSAGGNVVLETALRPSGPLTEGDRVASVVSLSGPTDLAALVNDDATEEGVRNAVLDYLGCEPSECPALYAAASPVEHVDAGDPPVFLANAEAERIPAAQVAALADPLESAGVDVRTLIVPGDKHGHGLIDQVWPDAVTFLQGTFGQPIVRPPHPNTRQIYEDATGADEDRDGRGPGGGGAKTPGTLPDVGTDISADPGQTDVHENDAGSSETVAGSPSGATAPAGDDGDMSVVALAAAVVAIVALFAAAVFVSYRRGRMAALAAATEGGDALLADPTGLEQVDTAPDDGTVATTASNR